MSFPITGSFALVLALLFGTAFGFLLHRGRVADYNTIVRQFLFRDFTVIKIMLTAIVVGGIGVFILVQLGYATFHIKAADLLAVSLGAALFGIGMVLYGYCPGTAMAAIGGGSLHALIGAGGMIVGAIIYALSYDWVRETILPVGALGRVQLHDMLGISPYLIFGALVLLAVVLFVAIERRFAVRG